MKVIYLTDVGFDTPNSNNHLANSLIEGLLSEGIDVHLIQSCTTKINDEIPSNLLNRSGFTYSNIQKKIVSKTAFVSRYIEGVKYAYKAKNKWKKVNVDLIIVQSSPTVFYHIRLLKKYFKKPIIYSVFDIFPGCAYEMGIIKIKSISNIFKWIQRKAYKYSDVIIGISDDMRTKLIQEGVNEDKIKTIVTWYDDGIVSEVPAWKHVI